MFELKCIGDTRGEELQKVLDKVGKGAYYLSKEDIVTDCAKGNLLGMYLKGELLCTATIEEFNDIDFMKRFVMVGPHGKGYFSVMVGLITQKFPYVCITVLPSNYKVSVILREAGFIYKGNVLDRTGEHEYTLFQHMAKPY